MKARAQVATLDKEDQAVFDKYIELLKAVPGPVSVWATTDEGMLHFYTLVSLDKEAETAVYKAEGKLLRAISPLLVDFDVHRHPDYVHQYLFKDERPLFHRD